MNMRMPHRSSLRTDVGIAGAGRPLPAGFSLVEMLIVTAILAVLMGAVFSIFFKANATYRMETANATHLQGMRIAMNQIVRSIRQAGNDPLKALTQPAVSISGGNSIILRTDITGSIASTTGNAAEARGDPDGTTNSIFEVVTFRHDSSGKAIYSNIGYGEQPLIQGIRSLSFTGYNLAGAVVTDPTQISRVNIIMVAEPTAAAAAAGSTITTTLVADAYVRSRTPQIAP